MNTESSVVKRPKNFTLKMQKFSRKNKKKRSKIRYTIVVERKLPNGNVRKRTIRTNRPRFKSRKLKAGEYKISYYASLYEGKKEVARSEESEVVEFEHKR